MSPGTASNDEAGESISTEESGVAETAAKNVAEKAQDIGAFIRSQRMLAEVSLRQLAERAGVSNPYLSQIERGLRKPSADVLAQIAKGLRMSAEVLYVRAGILQERAASPVRDALLADTAINERQKQVLLEIYDSFCHDNATPASSTPGGAGDAAETAPVADESGSASN
ncbi:helix-turn-helix domain-containing protein [Jongsikchunia kroppenstedtii]|uniref:helix-turn-helix domain-containing protein n=1 Tax=Jongsikchunia kroppenstedtii TaxID=1121721 RepID=UPI00035CE2DC